MGIIEQWCTLNDAVLNKEKCDVMVINSASLTSSLPLRKEVKYLGVSFNSKLSIKPHYEVIKKKIATRRTELQ